MWADSGDNISKQYAGTGALKNDYTRTGKRDARGLSFTREQSQYN